LYVFSEVCYFFAIHSPELEVHIALLVGFRVRVLFDKEDMILFLFPIVLEYWTYPTLHYEELRVSVLKSL
jgi:hypothetical protein